MTIIKSKFEKKKSIVRHRITYNTLHVKTILTKKHNTRKHSKKNLSLPLSVCDCDMLFPQILQEV